MAQDAEENKGTASSLLGKVVDRLDSADTNLEVKAEALPYREGQGEISPLRSMFMRVSLFTGRLGLHLAEAPFEIAKSAIDRHDAIAATGELPFIEQQAIDEKAVEKMAKTAQKPGATAEELNKAADALYDGYGNAQANHVTRRKAEEFYQRAADQNDPHAMERMGEINAGKPVVARQSAPKPPGR